MSNLTTVTVTAGVPTSGTGTVSTLDNLVGTAGSGSANVLTVQGNASGTAIPVSLTSTTITGTVTATQSGTWNVTNISGTVSLPTGAATAAKQPALGTAGSASADVISVQGIASMTALKVDGSAVTQPVSLTSTTVTGTVAVTQSGSWSLSANQSINNAQINGVTPLMGNGVTGTGSQRVTIASDNTAFSVNAVQSGTWNIGTVTTLPALVAGSALIGKVGIDQTTPGTTDSVSIKTQGFKSAQFVTRPANVTAYTANDALGAATAAITFSSIAPGSGEILIKSTELEIDVAAIPAGMTSFRLYLYNVTPPSALADNAAWDLPSGDRASFMGYIDLGTPVDLGSTLYVRTNAVDVQVTATGTSVFGYLVTNGGFTPAGNSEVYKVTLHAVAL